MINVTLNIPDYFVVVCWNKVYPKLIRNTIDIAHFRLGSNVSFSVWLVSFFLFYCPFLSFALFSPIYEITPEKHPNRFNVFTIAFAGWRLKNQSKTLCWCISYVQHSTQHQQINNNESNSSRNSLLKRIIRSLNTKLIDRIYPICDSNSFILSTKQ